MTGVPGQRAGRGRLVATGRGLQIVPNQYVKIPPGRGNGPPRPHNAELGPVSRACTAVESCVSQCLADTRSCLENCARARRARTQPRRRPRVLVCARCQAVRAARGSRAWSHGLSCMVLRRAYRADEHGQKPIRLMARWLVCLCRSACGGRIVSTRAKGPSPQACHTAAGPLSVRPPFVPPSASELCTSMHDGPRSYQSTWPQVTCHCRQYSHLHAPFWQREGCRLPRPRRAACTRASCPTPHQCNHSRSAWDTEHPSWQQPASLQRHAERIKHTAVAPADGTRAHAGR